MINVTKSDLPPIDDYIKYLQQIWENGHLTNNGPLAQELEAKLKEFLGVKHLFFVSNGTIALQIAIKALELKGDIITTPFSFVATTSSIVWENCRPVFVDIKPDTLCINPALIEDAITPDTTAILATHVYGHPCDVDHIKEIADRNGLKIIYDAAHAFGVNYMGTSILKHGDISTLSFHATKLFHTVEGGALITEDDELAHRISNMRNFGIKGQEEFWGLGINAKNSEFHAAMGLCNLPAVTEIIARRKQITETYDKLLSDCALERPTLPSDTDYNYAYYPVIFPSEDTLINVQTTLNNNDIFPRRYFYPPLNKLSYVEKRELIVTDSISKKVLCLPLYKDLNLGDVHLVSNIIKDEI